MDRIHLLLLRTLVHRLLPLLGQGLWWFGRCWGREVRKGKQRLEDSRETHRSRGYRSRAPLKRRHPQRLQQESFASGQAASRECAGHGVRMRRSMLRKVSVEESQFKSHCARVAGEKCLVDVPAFFSSMESVFQSRFWIASSCWWTVSCSSEVIFSHCASTFESGMTDEDAVEDEDWTPDDAAVAMHLRETAARRPVVRTAWTAGCIVEDGERCRCRGNR